MTSSRPYIIRAIYEWIVDNGLTPYILVDTRSEAVVVPESFIENNRIILNISPMATHDLSLGNEHVSFSARFSGSPLDVFIPTSSVLAIYAQENGQGMMFGDGNEPPPDSPSGGPDGGSPSTEGVDGAGNKKPSLKIVK